MFGGDPAELHVPTCTVELCSPRSSSIKYFDIRHHFSFLTWVNQIEEKFTIKTGRSPGCSGTYILKKQQFSYRWITGIIHADTDLSASPFIGPGCRSITPAHWESPRNETAQLFGSITMKGALPARRDRVLLNGGFLGSDPSNRIAAEATNLTDV